MKQEIVAYDPSIAAQLTQEAANMRNLAQVTITDELTLNQATDFVRDIKELGRRIEAERLKITKPLNEAIKGVNDLFRHPKEVLDEAERKVKSAILAYQQEQKRIADEAARKALQERLAAEAAARKAQEEAEAARRAAQAELAAAQAAQDEAAKARAIAEAAKAEAAAAQAEREAILNELIVEVPAQIVQPHKAEGTTTRQTFKASVSDLRALCKAIGEGRAPLEAVEPNMPYLNTQARFAKKESGTYIYDGVQSVAVVSLAVR
jgi:membrane protein involved in colicin uptake